LNTAKTAVKGTNEYTSLYEEIVNKHKEIIQGVLTGEQQAEVLQQIDIYHNELANIFKGVSLIKELSKKTEDTIVSYGERISSLFISKMLGADLFDSRDFIKTETSFGKHIVNFESTNALILIN
jgi:aspartokinase/homoserine dehydrogenase 1